ncbi:tail fiber assembly protein [Escherichia coli]|jgi:hypothetical protein|uniref:tail fiber assembly protein n=1 Tax=Escherichia coli TaxID=562 RepID=UPI000250D752|nr:hypothetical protein [Escherichia coli]EHV58035.1 sb25 domain protein [Escherichia coli DEC6B]EHV59956.1 tail fiber assembly protein [Escherichia coli DEC6A]MCS1315955.1 tail fiber assembly protein [Escherichia coli]STL44754.1 tail assembly chaperone gp38 [Escherichia coli]
MMDMKNFIMSSAETDDEKALAGFGALILRDSEGREWYTSQKLFSEDTIKIMYDKDGVVRSIATDVTTLWPASHSVAEVAVLPDGADIFGGWKYAEGKVTKATA